MDRLQQAVKKFCHNHNLALNKALGQHFLTDQNVLMQIIASADLKPDDEVVEIGPGIGVLTKELLSKSKKVTAIEIDKRMIPLINEYTKNKQLTTNNKQLTVISSNALKTPMPNNPYKVVANIPYHITSPLLRHVFLESEIHPTSITLLIQREVAEKICDKKNAGLLTILVSLFGEAEIVTHVPPSAFLPPPKVDSSVLHIKVFPKPLVKPEVMEEIFKLTKTAFSQKRKMLRKTLGSSPKGIARLKKAGIDPTRRPQNLSIEEWIKLASL